MMKLGKRDRFPSRVAVVLMCLTAHWAIAQSTGSIQGKVTDSSGAPVLGAVITVTAADGTRYTTVSDIEGAFNLSSLTLANYEVKISATGLSDWTAARVPASANSEASPVLAVLQVAPLVTTVTVGVGPDEVASMQLTQELKQRVLGVIPNYFVSFEKNPAPLSAKQKTHLGFRLLLDPTTFAAVVVTADIQQAKDSYRQFGQGADGFAKRFGAAYGISVDGIVITSVLADSVFHQDPRYLYSGQGTKGQRAWYAVKSAFLSRGDNGQWEPPYDNLVGVVASAELSQLYLPGSRTQYTLLGRSLMFRFAGLAAMNLGEEFFLKKMTSNRPAAQAENVPVLREGTPVSLIALDGLSADGATKGKTVMLVLADDLTVNGKVLASSGDVASGEVAEVDPGTAPTEATNIGLEQVTLRAGQVDVPLRSSQSRGVVGPMQYKELPESGKLAVTLYVARSVPFPDHQ